MVKNQLKKRTGAETPEQAIEVADIIENYCKHLNGLQDSPFTEPIFDATNELFEPIGNFKCIWNDQLYDLSHNDDPQLIAQILAGSLRLIKVKTGSLGLAKSIVFLMTVSILWDDIFSSSMISSMMP